MAQLRNDSTTISWLMRRHDQTLEDHWTHERREQMKGGAERDSKMYIRRRGSMATIDADLKPKPPKRLGGGTRLKNVSQFWNGETISK